ncbi:hypothetical protein AAG906_003565 [Vitis piasezkii]
MTTNVGFGALCTSPKGETILFHSDVLNKSNFIIPKRIMWNEVEGDLIFSNSFRHSINLRISYYEPSRASSSSIPDESPDMSPTYSQMINTVSLDDEDFEINKDLLRKDFYSEVNKKIRVCKRVNNTSTKTKIWKTSDETVIESIHPPEAKIEKNINGTIVKASPFKTKPEDKGTASNNYTNMFLKTLGDQLNKTIVAGFTSQQKGWWDNYLTFEYRNGILKAYRINEGNEVVKDEEGQDIEDAMATLIYSISKHFIGDPTKIKDKIDLLTNLKCSCPLGLHDFRGYKEVFLTKVMLRSNCNKSFWKEEFISGLPRLFSERIRIKIREYIVTTEGIKLYNDFKLKQQMKNEQRIYKNEFGSFCNQFGFNQKETKSPSKQRKKQVSRKPSKEKFYHSKRDDINQLDSGEEFSSQTCSDQEECITGNCDCQPKTINVISQDQELVLDVLRKVKDEKTKQELYEKTVNPYSLNEILTRFNQRSPKEVTIKDLQEEVRQYKNEIRDLRQFTNLGNLVDNQENLEEVPEFSQANDEEADAYLNTVKGLVPIQFYEKTKQTLFGANGKRLAIKYKLSNAHICNQGICIKQTFIIVKDLKEKALLGVPFLSSIYPMWNRRIIKIKKTQDAIEKFKDKIVGEVCSNLPNAFWHKKQHEVELPYEPNFSEKNIPTKARPIQMNKELLSYCENEIQDLLDKKLIRKSKSPWSCPAFYVKKQVELERGTPRLVINYKPFNDALRWIRYSIPNKTIFNAPSEFQNIMNEIFNQFTNFIIIVENIKSRVKTLPCLSLANPEAFKIVKTNASDIAYGWILKQRIDNQKKLVRYTSGTWDITQLIHDIIKKKIF